MNGRVIVFLPVEGVYAVWHGGEYVELHHALPHANGLSGDTFPADTAFDALSVWDHERGRPQPEYTGDVRNVFRAIEIRARNHLKGQ